MKVWMQIDGCKETGNLDITFYSEVNDGMFPVMEVTEEFGVPMEKNRMFIKESMTVDFALAFLQKYGIGTPTGIVLSLQYPAFPVSVPSLPVREFPHTAGTLPGPAPEGPPH